MGTTRWPVQSGLFSSDTIIPMPNSAGTQKSALELVAAYTDTTAGSEDTTWTIKVLGAGAQVNAQVISEFGTTFPVGAFSTPSIAFGSRGLFDDLTYLRVKTGGRAHYFGDTFIALDPAAASAGFYLDLTFATGFVLDTAMTGGTGVKILGGSAVGMRANAVGICFQAATAPVAPQTSGANLTNSVTSGGVNDTITDWTNLTTYSTDAAAIRNAVYQLARKLKQVNDGLRTYGLFT